MIIGALHLRLLRKETSQTEAAICCMLYVVIPSRRRQLTPRDYGALPQKVGVTVTITNTT